MLIRDNFSARGHRGFALLVTIVLVAFLVLLLVGLATFTRVETQVSANSQQLAQARQNALSALNIAIGEIQEHAGPDARVTARADVLESNDVNYARNPYYVGVWDSSNTNVTPRTWLISGNEVSAVNTPAQTPLVDRNRNVLQNTDTLITLVGTNTAGTNGGVVVPKVDIVSASVPGFTGNVTVGRYAWWVGDEGMKARVNLPENSSNLSPYVTRADLRAVPRQESPRQTPIATALAGASNTDAQLDGVIVDKQLALLSGVVATDVLDRYHDVSSTSLGVVANTESDPTGGLKRDLSVSPSLISAEFANVADYGTYMQAPGAGQYTRRYQMKAPSATTSGAYIDSVAPALTEFVLQFYLSGTVGSTNVNLRVQGLYELLNPYTSELVLEPLQLIVEGLPAVSVSVNGGPASATVNLDTVLRGAQSNVVIHLPDASALADPQLFRFLPGRLLSWGGTAAPGSTTGTPAPSLLATANQRTASAIQRDFTAVATLGAPLAVGDTFSLSSAGTSTLTVRLVRASNGNVLATYQSPVFSALVKPSYTATSQGNPFAYRFRMKDRIDYAAATNPGEWLVDIEPRHPLPPQSYFTTATAQPGSAANGSSASINDTAQLFNRSASTGAAVASIRHVQDTAFFELPRDPYTNIGSLQNLGRIDSRPYALGNSWGGTVNSAFDRFYFSGVTATDPVLGASPQDFRNQRMKLYVDDPAAPPSLATFRGVAGSRSARYVLAQGQFNVNSTSEVAWRTILASTTVPSWDYVNPGDYGAQNTGAQTSTAALEGVFLRFPQSAQETYDIGQTGSVASGVNLAPTTQRRHYRRGVVRVSDPDRVALAARIVRNIKVKANATGPFRTIKEFLDPQAVLGGQSVLEEAISHTATTVAATWVHNERAFNDFAPALTGALDAYSASYLLQSDILSSIAAAISARSDTFTVRAYGEVLNPASQARESSAWLEATVQRVPTFVDATENPELDFSALNSTNQAFGRKFKVTQIRWLSTNDL